MPRETTKTYDNLCVKCGNTMRYVSNNQCVYCKLKGNPRRQKAETFEGKVCRKCGGTTRYMSSKRCVYCLSQIVTNWVTNNPERAQARYKPQRAIEQYRQRTYGITQQESDHMFFCQRGICAICDEPLTKPHVDHNHVTGKVRGLLCGPCNHGIGSLKDNTTILRNAITYLETSG